MQGSGKLPSSTQLPIPNPPAPILGWMGLDMKLGPQPASPSNRQELPSSSTPAECSPSIVPHSGAAPPPLHLSAQPLAISKSRSSPPPKLGGEGSPRSRLLNLGTYQHSHPPRHAGLRRVW